MVKYTFRKCKKSVELLTVPIGAIYQEYENGEKLRLDHGLKCGELENLIIEGKIFIAEIK